MTSPERLIDNTIGALFTSVVASTPNAIAVRSGDCELSYAELDAQANRLAHHLRRLGVRRESPVGVVNDHSPTLVISLLAIIKAGGCYLGIDSKQPAERIASMLSMAGVELVLTDGSAALAPGAAVRWLDVRELDLSGEPSTDPALPCSPDQLAYLGYTSGSTGVPKAAMIPQAGVIRLVRNTNYLTVRPEDVFVQLAPLAFDLSTLELWAPLLNGACLVVPSQQPEQIAEIGALVRRHRVSVLWLTAGLFHQFCNAGLPGLHGLRCLLAGGDVVSAPGANRVLTELPGVELINGYGPTENTTFTTCYSVRQPQDDRVPIGFPISGTTVHLLDEQLRPVPDGEAGELCTGGLGLARGYLGRPGVTAERFVPDPFAEQPGGRLYRTGDLARRRDDGALDFLGRLDDQVKIRGFRVEPGEVEVALRGLAEIKDAAVTVQQSRFGRRLIGFAVVAEGASANPVSVRRNLTSLLPDYAVPSRLVLLTELPLNINGKIDRSSLQRYAGPRRPAGLSNPYQPPDTETEQLVVATWELMLDLAGIGVHDDFFELGGHSLIAAAITAELSEQTGVRVQPRQLYEHSTVAELAGLLDQLRAGQLDGAARLTAASGPAS